MESVAEMGQGDSRVPRLAAGWQRRSENVSPQEGFLLSRIDGRTSWTLLREIGGLPPGEVDRCLERWLAEGLLEVAEAAGGPAAGGPAEPDVDPSLDLSLDLQREILACEASLDRPYHELLGIERDADDKAIKRAYFALSKRFHPDRYFRQEIGGFYGRLERIFKKLVEAYELLSDPSTRAELERSLPEPPPAEVPETTPQRSSGRVALDRLRRMLRIPEEVLAERKLKARQFYDSYRVAAAQGRWLEAAACTRLAIAFDPAQAEYKKAFAEVQTRVYELRAAELLERADASMDAKARQEALRLYEEVIHFEPRNAPIHHRAAGLALELGDFEKAQEYAEAACDVAPEVCDHHVLLCRILRRAGLRERARRALETAEQLDPKNEDVKRERRALQKTKRRK